MEESYITCQRGNDLAVVEFHAAYVLLDKVMKFDHNVDTLSSFGRNLVMVLLSMS